MKNKEIYDPIPRRPAPPPKFNQKNIPSESQHSPNNSTPLAKTPVKQLSSTLIGEIHSKASSEDSIKSGDKPYDNRPRRSAPRPPTK